MGSKTGCVLTYKHDKHEKLTAEEVFSILKKSKLKKNIKKSEPELMCGMFPTINGINCHWIQTSNVFTIKHLTFYLID